MGNCHKKIETNIIEYDKDKDKDYFYFLNKYNKNDLIEIILQMYAYQKQFI